MCEIQDYHLNSLEGPQMMQIVIKTFLLSAMRTGVNGLQLSSDRRSTDDADSDQDLFTVSYEDWGEWASVE